MPRLIVPAALALAAVLSAQTALFPLKDLKPGMRGTGRTVFNGNKIEDFQVEILGVLDNIGPKDSLILARLSGGGWHAGEEPWEAAIRSGFIHRVHDFGGHGPSRVGGAGVALGAARVTFWGALAMAATAGVGALFGTATA